MTRAGKVRTGAWATGFFGEKVRTQGVYSCFFGVLLHGAPGALGGRLVCFRHLKRVLREGGTVDLSSKRMVKSGDERPPCHYCRGVKPEKEG